MIENIRQEGKKVDWQNHDSIIKFYEKNQLIFDNYDLITNEEDIEDIIQMKIRYINSLNAKKRFTKAFNIISHLDKMINKLNENSVIYEKYNMEKLFYYGVLKGNLKDYLKSYSTFSKLVNLDPENDLYKEWHVAMKMEVQYLYLRYVSFIGLAIVLGNIILDLAFEYKMNTNIKLFGWLLIIVGWIGPKVYQYINKNR